MDTRISRVVLIWTLRLLLLDASLLLAACANVPARETTAPLSAAIQTESTPPSPQDGDVSSAGWWRPVVGATWQWQLQDTPVDRSFDVDVYDIDLFESGAADVAILHGEGRRVVCYISAGSWEEWRPDADQFLPELLGNDYEGWPGERWLDIRQIDRLAPVLRARLDQCKEKGFDAVEPDNIDGYSNDTGFPLTADDQLRFNRWLAGEAHARGLSIGLKNDPEQAAALEPAFDWAMTEDCFAEGWCEEMLPFIRAGKPVFAAEYTDTGVALDEICPEADELRFSVIMKNRELDAERARCP